MVGRNQEEEEEGPVGREELELEAGVVVVVRAEVGLVGDHCLFHSSVGRQMDHSGWLVVERRDEV